MPSVPLRQLWHAQILFVSVQRIAGIPKYARSLYMIKARSSGEINFAVMG